MIEANLLAELWEEHSDRLLLIARSIGGPAEDAVQEAFISLATEKKLPDDPMAWLVRVTRNRLMQWHRSGRRRRQRESLVCDRPWFEHEAMSAQQRIDAAEVTQALQQLPSPDREVIVMHLWGEMTFEAIAKVVGGSRAKSHRTFRRGLETLKQRFGQESVPSVLSGDASSLS